MSPTDDHVAARPRATRGRLRHILSGHDFTRDILVTTIGVLLALGIGELVVEWRKQRDAAEAVAAMREDAVPNTTALIERVVVGRCVAKRLAQLRAIMDHSQSVGRLPDIQPFGHPPARPYPRTAWNVAVGQGATSHIDRATSDGFRFFYDSIAKFEEVSNAEQASWNMLKLLEQRPGRWPTELSADLYRAHVFATDNNRLTQIIGRQALRRSSELGVPWKTFSGAPIDWEKGVGALMERQICRPLIVDARVYRLPAAVRVQS